MTAQLEEFTVAGDNQAVVGVKWCHDGECGYWYHVVTLRRDKSNSHPGLRQPVGGTVIGRAELTTVRSDLADAWAPYLTMGEAIKVTAQSFTMDVEMLSCCAA